MAALVRVEASSLSRRSIHRHPWMPRVSPLSLRRLHLPEVARVPSLRDLLHISYFVPQLLYRASVDFGRGLKSGSGSGWGDGVGGGAARILIFLSAPLLGYIQNRPGPHLFFVSLASKAVFQAALKEMGKIGRWQEVKLARAEKWERGKDERKASINFDYRSIIISARILTGPAFAETSNELEKWLEIDIYFFLFYSWLRFLFKQLLESWTKTRFFIRACNFSTFYSHCSPFR